MRISFNRFDRPPYRFGSVLLTLFFLFCGLFWALKGARYRHVQFPDELFVSAMLVLWAWVHLYFSARRKKCLADPFCCPQPNQPAWCEHLLNFGLVMFFGFFLYSGLVFCNGALDPSPGQGFSAVVEDKNPKRGIRGSDTLTIRTPSGRHHVVVPTAIFKSSQPGQSLPILVRPGYFQWEWFEGMDGGGTSPATPA